MSSQLTAADVESLRRAVTAGEAESAGDIVPYLVRASDVYPGAVWRAATLGALAGAVLAWLVERQLGTWPASLFATIVLPPAAGAALGILAVHLLPALRRWLIGKELLALRVQQRAAATFLEQGVHRTTHHHGILIFLSVFERRVVVLADSGIHERVDDGEWERLTARIIGGIRAGDPAGALVQAIHDCSELLVLHRLRRPPGEPAELSGEPREGGQP